MITDNRILVENIRPTRTIFCIQRTAEKVVPTEDTQVKSNLASFGDDIGKTTNRVTAMYDVQSYYQKGSAEYDTLEYRIQSGQLFQQNAIDRIKGIVCNPMPKAWFDYHANALPENPTEEDEARREFNLRILADKKPYFMRYIYPALMKQYKTYMKNVETKCAREFRMSLNELLAMDAAERTPEQETFISYYKRRMPVGVGDCVMNRICRRFENEFDGKMKAWCDEPFDYTIMKSDVPYTSAQFAKVKKLYSQHMSWITERIIRNQSVRADKDRRGDAELLRTWFIQECYRVNANGYAVCNMILDMCYRNAGSKEFAWDVSPYYIIANLVRRHGGMMHYPVRDDKGEIEFGGMRFTMHEAEWVWEEAEEELLERNSAEREGMGEEGD